MQNKITDKELIKRLAKKDFYNSRTIFNQKKNLKESRIILSNLLRDFEFPQKETNRIEKHLKRLK